MDVMGDFETIQEAQERIPRLQDKLTSFNSNYEITSILKIVETDEMGINDFYVYQKDEKI